MQKSWDGPYEVVERVNEVTCNIQKSLLQGCSTNCACEHAKPTTIEKPVVNMICCAEDGSKTAPLIDLMAECHNVTSLGSNEISKE